MVWAVGTRTWRFLALPHGINYMGSEIHSPVYIFVLLLPLISPLGLEVYGFSIYSWTFFWLVTGYSQVRPRHQLADCSDHILLIQDPARRGGSMLRLDHSGSLFLYLKNLVSSATQRFMPTKLH